VGRRAGAARHAGRAVRKLNGEINAALNSGELRESLAKLGVEPMPWSPNEFATFIAAEARKWGELVELSGEKAQ